MTIAFTCVLIAIILPYIWAWYAKSPAIKAGSYDNNNPRALLARLEGPSLRANWAQQNAFEALPGFIAAVIIAHVTGVAQHLIDSLAAIFVICRIAHGIFYIKDAATLRSTVWMVGFVAVIGLFVAVAL